MLKRALLVAVLFVACGGSEAPPVQPGKVDLPIPPAVTASSESKSGATPAASTSSAVDEGPPGPPPPATWDYTVEEKSNTCPAFDGGARLPVLATRGLFIPSHPAKDGTIVANILLPASPVVVARHDLRLEVGKIVSSSSKPDRTCPAFEMKREMEFKEITGNKMVLSVRTEYGDAKTCNKPPPLASCKSDVLVTYKLLEKLCEPRCIFTNAKLGVGLDAGPPTGKCVCPDAGAP